MAPKTIVVMILLITISVNYYFILPLMLMVCWAVNGNEDIWLQIKGQQDIQDNWDDIRGVTRYPASLETKDFLVLNWFHQYIITNHHYEHYHQHS